MATYTIEIPNWHPARINQFVGKHWGVGHRLKKADVSMIAFYAKLAHVPIASKKRRMQLTIVYGKRKRQADKDAYWKSLLDALVCAGMLVDDSPKWVTCEEPIYERAAKSLTRIELTDIDEVE